MFDWFTLHVGALVATGTIFGGMAFFAFVFTPMVFRFCEREDAAQFLRQVFPVYHRLLAVCCVVPAVLLMPGGTYSVEIGTLLGVAILFLVAARFLVPAANKAREAGDTAKFRAVHRISVLLHMAQMIAVLVTFIRLGQ